MDTQNQDARRFKRTVTIKSRCDSPNEISKVCSDGIPERFSKIKIYRLSAILRYSGVARGYIIVQGRGNNFSSLVANITKERKIVLQKRHLCSKFITTTCHFMDVLRCVRFRLIVHTAREFTGENMEITQGCSKSFRSLFLSTCIFLDT